MTIANDLGERGSNFGRTRKRLPGLKEGNGRGLSRPDRLQPDTQEGAQSRRMDTRVLGMDLRGGGPSARNHRLRGQPDGRGERMAAASLPKERASGGLQGSAVDHEAEFRRAALVVHLSARAPRRRAAAPRGQALSSP